MVEINQRAFRDSGELHPTGETYANMNNNYLGGLKIYPRVTSIQIIDAKDTVYVAVSTDISALFPDIVPKVFVKETGTAQVKSFGR
ncbi:MAG: hypothetical protein NTW32_21765 [Chloroflexi bacterium]|nr:hypothetical protein [Chloroflexota bacterium]